MKRLGLLLILWAPLALAGQGEICNGGVSCDTTSVFSAPYTQWDTTDATVPENADVRAKPSGRVEVLYNPVSAADIVSVVPLPLDSLHTPHALLISMQNTFADVSNNCVALLAIGDALCQGTTAADQANHGDLDAECDAWVMVEIGPEAGITAKGAAVLVDLTSSMPSFTTPTDFSHFIGLYFHDRDFVDFPDAKVGTCTEIRATTHYFATTEGVN